MNNYRQGTMHNASEIHPSSCTTVYDEGDNNIRILSSPIHSQEIQNKTSFMISNNLTSTPNKLPSKDLFTKKLSTVSLKENIDLNQENLRNNDNVEYVATTPEDEIKKKNSNDNTNNNNSTSDFTIKPIQKQNSMVLSREQLKQMTKEKEKEKTHHIDKISKESKESPKIENIDTLDEDLKNIPVQEIDSHKSSDIEAVKSNKENETSPENSVKKAKRKRNKKKKKNILLSPSDRILKELCESSDIELNNSLDIDTDDDDDDVNSIDNSQDTDDEESYSNPLNSSQKSEEIVKNINTIQLGKVLLNPGELPQNEMNIESSENNKDQKDLNKINPSKKSESDKKKKKNKSKKKSKRRETIIPETPSAIRTDSSDNEDKYLNNKDGLPPEEKKVYIWKTNYQKAENVGIPDLQNQSLMFDDNDDLDISKEMKKINSNYNNIDNKANNDDNIILLKSPIGNKEITNNGKKQEEDEIIKDHDITINDNDINIIEVLKSMNNIDTNNTMKFKKTKQQTLYNYTNTSPTNR